MNREKIGIIDGDKYLAALQEKAKTKGLSEATINGLCGAVAILFEQDEVATVAPQPVIHAKWIKEETIYGWDGRSYQCSECGRSVHLDPIVEDIDLDYPYCHCGAKMDRKDEE